MRWARGGAVVSGKTFPDGVGAGVHDGLSGRYLLRSAEPTAGTTYKGYQPQDRRGSCQPFCIHTTLTRGDRTGKKRSL